MFVIILYKRVLTWSIMRAYISTMMTLCNTYRSEDQYVIYSITK